MGRPMSGSVLEPSQWDAVPLTANVADDEKPVHPVDIENGFWLGQTEVTIGSYRRFALKHNLEVPTGNDVFPVTGLTWAKAKEYCAAIRGRLPTEAEWEYSARAGDTHSYYGVVPNIAWYSDNSDDTVHPVGTKQPNAFGLYDMLGNVKEWVLDRYYKKYYLDSPTNGHPRGSAHRCKRLGRGPRRILGERCRFHSGLAPLRGRDRYRRCYRRSSVCQ